jgi:hypothetical protein
MKKPVRKYTSPKYPTRLEIAAQPFLLQRHQPPAWRKWPELTGAAGLFLLADNARLAAADGSQKGAQVQTNALAIVAPIFEHGKGRGATGCIVMSPPVFMSEEEALQVIREEMSVKGITLRTDQTAVPGVTVMSKYKPGVPAAPEPFQAEAADPNKRVFVEFISQRQARRWERERWLVDNDSSGMGGTAVSYNMPKTASYVADRVKRQATEKVYFGTFYDPLATSLETTPHLSEKPTGKALPGAQDEAKPDSRRLLRLQVQDFLKWLQAQGAI